jgi:DNA-damage-inducible protein J
MSMTIQVRVDEETKLSADALFTSMGFDISTAVRMFLAASLQANGIPFELKRQFNEETVQAMRDSRNKNKLLGPFKNASEMIAAALEDDDA